MKITIRQKLVLFALIILACNGISGYFVYKSSQKLLDSEQWIHHTEQVIYQATNISSIGKDIETASRGYIITCDSAFLQPLYIAKKSVFINIWQLKQITRDNYAQQQRADSLNFYMHKLIYFSFKTVELRNEQGLNAAIAYTSTKLGKHYTDHIRRITDAIQAQGAILLKIHRENNARNAAAFKQYSAFTFILLAVFTSFLLIVISKYLLQNKEKAERAEELVIANENLLFQNDEKEKRAAELVEVGTELAIANEEISFQNNERGERAEELLIANEELFYQNEEKEKRAAELVVANEELYFQNDEKEKRAAELVIANKALLFQNNEKEKRAAELIIANAELSFQNDEKGKRAAELVIANYELSFQNDEKGKRAAELVIANKELSFQNNEKGKRAAELVIANKELLFQNDEKEKRAAELVVANKELLFQNDEKGKRAAELVVANKELLFQNKEKEKRAAELVIANKELLFQSEEKEKRAIEKEFDRNNLNALINNTDDLMWSVDKNFNLITSNQPFNEFVKVYSGEIIKNGDSVLSSKFTHEQSVQYKKFYMRTFEGGTFSEIIYEVLPVESWSEVSYSPIRKGDEVIGAACQSHNITEKIKAERQLRYSEAFNRGVLNSLSSHIAVIDKLGTIVAVNESWQRFAIENGKTVLQGSGVGSNYFEVCEKSAKEGEEVADEALQGIKDVINEKVPVFYLEYSCHSPDQQRWFGMRVMKFDSDDQMVVISHQNISERKLAEANLSQSESSLKEAQAIAQLGNFEIDMVHYSEIWSDQMYKILGVEKTLDPSKESFASFIHPDDLNASRKAFKSLKNDSMDYRLIRRDGAVIYVSSQWRFKFNMANEPVRLYGVLQDITERKLAEIERLKMVNELMLRNNDLEQFAYIISHNLRAPVANIIGASSALNDIGLDTEDKEILSRGINTSIMKLDEVVKDLNQILQVKGKINDIKELVRFSELVEDIKISIKNLIDKDDIEIKYDFAEVNELLTLKPYLYSIFFNLISNSVKYRRQHIHSFIKIRSRLKNNKAELIFTDNGMGINLKKSGNHIFGLYKRFHTDDIEGKGMGLFMVKTQVETLGGKISIKSTENKGTEFLIEFET